MYIKIKPLRVRKRVFLSVLALTAILILLFLLYLTAKNNWAALTGAGGTENTRPVVIVDPGHGGIDGGAVGEDGTLEKDVNLQISLCLDEMLQAFGFQTLLTRDSDRSIHSEEAKTVRQQKVSDIHNRAALLENTENALLLSIHQNQYSGAASAGTQVFYSPNHAESELLAEAIQHSVAGQLQPENKRQIKKAGTGIYLLYYAQKPAVMVECGFLSNAAEREKLKDPAYQQKLSFAIACGVVEYFNTCESCIFRGEMSKKIKQGVTTALPYRDCFVRPTVLSICLSD